LLAFPNRTAIFYASDSRQSQIPLQRGAADIGVHI
jgi:hypothetical protein